MFVLTTGLTQIVLNSGSFYFKDIKINICMIHIIIGILFVYPLSTNNMTCLWKACVTRRCMWNARLPGWYTRLNERMQRNNSVIQLKTGGVISLWNNSNSSLYFGALWCMLLSAQATRYLGTLTARNTTRSCLSIRFIRIRVYQNLWGPGNLD